MKIIAIINNSAGSLAELPAGDRAAYIRQLFQNVGVDAEVIMTAGTRVKEIARRAANAPVNAVIAGGGDGTISAVAGALARTKMPLGILPLGTLNHFAKDVGIPLDLADASA